jgi:hypothetical protein
VLLLLFCCVFACLQRVFRLPDLWVRPGLGGKGRKMPGTLEAHQNGFRCGLAAACCVAAFDESVLLE